MKTLVPLGDQAALAYFDEESEAVRFAAAVRGAGDDRVIDVVSAYASVAIFFDLDRTDFVQMSETLRQIETAARGSPAVVGKQHRIPCCYEFQLDAARIAAVTKLSVDEIIRLHTATEYTVYAIGFCPGFPYLGYLPEELSGVPRLDSPRLRVEAGSVGLTGRQTGIYTESRPGGWNLLGRTPLALVNVADGYFPLRVGDTVQFERIDSTEFQRLHGERLAT